MKKIIVGFSHATSPWAIGSTIIAESEKRDYSHCYIRILDPETGIQMVYQASHGYVNTMTFQSFKTANIVVKEYILNPSDKAYLDMVFFCKSYLGAEYSKMQLIFITIKKLLHIQLNINNNNKAFICSEFAAKVCQCDNIKFDADLDYETPSNLDKVLQDNKINCIQGEYNG